MRELDLSRSRLSRSELAARAGAEEEEIDRLVHAGVLVPRERDEAPFLAVDILKIRVVNACEEGGPPIDAMAAAIKEGRLSLIPDSGSSANRLQPSFRRFA